MFGDLLNISHAIYITITYYKVHSKRNLMSFGNVIINNNTNCAIVIPYVVINNHGSCDQN